MADGDDIKSPQRREIDKRRRARNWAVLAVLAGLAVLFYAITIVRLGGG